MVSPRVGDRHQGYGRARGAPAPDFRQRILQIHPTLMCNLRCTHCYSSSSPAHHSALDAQTLCSVVSDAAALGYHTVAFSGGEPLLYRDLVPVLVHAKGCGMSTSLTTNGTLLYQKRLHALEGCLDLIAISLDGPPDLHNEVRQSRQAFDRLSSGLEHVRASGIPFGFIHTVTRRSWEHLLWVTEFAACAGATLLQLHPLELSGRADQFMRGAEPDDDLLARVYLLSLALRHDYGGSLLIQFDAFHADDLVENPDLIYAADLAPPALEGSAADLLGLLVVEADGTVVPISYGFSHDYKVCALPVQALADAWPVYVKQGYLAFRALCREVFADVTVPRALPFLDWHAMIVARSHGRG